MRLRSRLAAVNRITLYIDLLYCQDWREKVKEELGDSIQGRGLIKALAARWNDLSEADREVRLLVAAPA